jgi:Fe-S cluster assembly iron-binding protein IscA
MALIIDRPTLALWKSQGVSKVFVGFSNGGCSGTKLSVTTDAFDTTGLVKAEITNGIDAYFRAEDAGKLSEGRATRVEKNGKQQWIFTSGSVRGRCGCGTSFSFSDAPAKPKIDHSKLALLRASMKKSA